MYMCTATAAEPTAVPRAYKCPLSPFVHVCVRVPSLPLPLQSNSSNYARAFRGRGGGTSEKNVVP